MKAKAIAKRLQDAMTSAPRHVRLKKPDRGTRCENMQHDGQQACDSHHVSFTGAMKEYSQTSTWSVQVHSQPSVSRQHCCSQGSLALLDRLQNIRVKF
jgi:hypothetical protein